MDKKQSIINISVSIFFKIILLVLTLLTKRFLIQYVGNVANGILSLYTSIIGFLAIADLGIGTAITFSMYKPIVENDKPKISALYRMFIKFYTIVGCIILVLGFLITPVLPFIAKDYGNINLYTTFLIMLSSIFVSYMYSAKTSVINAYKNNYITTTIHSIGLIIEGVLQIILLYFYRSFELFLICKLISELIQWGITAIYFNKHHKILKEYHDKLDANTKKEVSMKTKAMFMHKIGGLLVNTCDSLIISSAIGVVILGKYNNYTTIVVAMNGIIMLFFTPLTGIIGHLCAKEDRNLQRKYSNFFYGVNFVLGLVFYLGYYAVIDDVILICFGKNLELDKSISFVITLNYFIQFMRTSTLTFRDATGTFYNDRFKPLVEGVLNLVLSLILVKYMGITGVIIATIITNVLICHLVEPYVLYKHGFEVRDNKFFIMNYSFIFIFFISLVCMHYSHIQFNNVWISFFANGSIAVAIAIIPILLMFFVNKDFRAEVIDLTFKIIARIKKVDVKM